MEDAGQGGEIMNEERRSKDETLYRERLK